METLFMILLWIIGLASVALIALGLVRLKDMWEELFDDRNNYL